MSRIWSEEQLTAYLDGELGPADADALTADLATDAALADRLARQAGANAAFVSSVAGIDARPMPAGVQALLAEANAAAARASGAGNVVAMRPRIGQWLMQHRAAAALIVAIGAFAAYSGLRPGAEPNVIGAGSVVVADTGLGRALDTVASAQTVKLADGAMLTPKLSFISADGSYCRQFDVAGTDGASASVACREPEGWRLALSVATRAAGPDFQTASGARPPALEAFLDERMSGPALSAEQEKAVIGQRWKPPAQSAH